MLLNHLAGRRVVFVGGKGGVGKTSLASGYALAAARTGARVLVASTDPAHNLGQLWHREVGDDAVRLWSGSRGEGSVDGLEVDPGRTVDRHLAAVGQTMRRMLPERLHPQAEQHLARARQAPGTYESAVLERIAEVVEQVATPDAGTETGYDLVLFDTAPTGHTLRLMALPAQLGDWTEALLANRNRSERFGAAMRGIATGRDEPETTDRDAELRRVLHRRRRRFALLHRSVTDPAWTGFVIVLTAERLPVAESVDLHRNLTELGVEVAAVVANRLSPTDAGELWAQRRELEDACLSDVREQLPGLPLMTVPLLAGDLTGPDALGRLADLLGDPAR